MKYLYYSILALIVFTLLAGFMSLFFIETEGVVSKATKSEVNGAAYTATRGGVRSFDGGKKAILNVHYEYTVGQEEIKSSIKAFWLINSPKETYWAGKKVKVFYAGFAPRIAVLKKGPDIFLLLILILVIMIYFFIKLTIMAKYKDV